MSEKLKPCPFCGGMNLTIQKYAHLCGQDRFRIFCECGCSMDAGFWIHRNQAVEAWNRRASGWIHIKTRPLTEEEKKEYPDWSYILDCELPDDGQRILIHCVYNDHESVQLDEYYDDCGMSYLDSGYELGEEVDAWMPLPEPPEVEK